MEHGAGHGVTAIPAGAAVIVPRIKMPFIVTVMEHGAVHSVPVTPVGAAAIALSRMHVVETDSGIIILMGPDIVPVIPAGGEAIARKI